MLTYLLPFREKVDTQKRGRMRGMFAGFSMIASKAPSSPASPDLLPRGEKG